MDISSISLDEFKDNVKEITKKAAREKLKTIDPKKEEILAVYDIIKTFIINKKRKVYGGFALNMLLTNKDIKHAIYDSDDMPDIDFYSTEPLKDIKELCDIIFKAGFEPVLAEEAQHNESYKIHVNYQTYCDVTYMPTNIYHKTRFIQINNMNIIHPHFMMVDYFRAFTDPLISYRLFEKMFPRYMALQKTYPLPLIKKPLVLKSNTEKTVNLLFDKLITMENILFSGFYTYNYYMNISQFDNKEFKLLTLPFLEIYSTDYIKDGLELIEFCKTLQDITHEEHYPFFQFLGNYTVFYMNINNKKEPILYLYSNNMRCIPYKNAPAIKFENEKATETETNIKLCCFDHNILHGLIKLVMLRVEEDEKWSDPIYKYLNGLVLFRNHYNSTNKTNGFADTIFQQFVIECYGKVYDPQREQRLRIKKRLKEKLPIKFRYDPEKNKDMPNFIFQNSSGNVIKIEKNLKLKAKIKSNSSSKEDSDDSDNSDLSE